MDKQEKLPEFVVEFLPVGQSKKRGITTVAILTVSATGETYKGIAHCNPTDTYVEAIGQRIAEARARKKYFKYEANKALAQHRVAQRLVEETKKYAEKKLARHAREEQWLANYVASV